MREDWFKEYPLQKLVFDSDNRKKYINETQWKTDNS